MVEFVYYNHEYEWDLFTYEEDLTKFADFGGMQYDVGQAIREVFFQRNQASGSFTDLLQLDSEWVFSRYQLDS